MMTLFLVITTLFLLADWFMDRYLLPRNLGFIFGIVLWRVISLTNRKRRTHFSIDLLSISFMFSSSLKLFHLYKTNGEKERSFAMAEAVVNKPMKIETAVIKRMKREMEGEI